MVLPGECGDGGNELADFHVAHCVVLVQQLNEPRCSEVPEVTQLITSSNGAYMCVALQTMENSVGAIVVGIGLIDQ